jgi:hypothetical protein
MAPFFHTVEYHDCAESGATQSCPTSPIFVENVWLATRILDGEEIHVVTVDYRKFAYA